MGEPQVGLLQFELKLLRALEDRSEAELAGLSIHRTAFRNSLHAQTCEACAVSFEKETPHGIEK